MSFSQADPGQLRVLPLAKRRSKSEFRAIAIDPDDPPPPAPHLRELIEETADRIAGARRNGAAVILAFGAHLIKNGAGPLVIRLMEQGWLTHVATQGAGGIHDWEFAFMGRSEEDVRANVATGTFGAWDETGRYINLAVLLGGARGCGYGESLGTFIHEEGAHIPAIESLRSEIEAGLSSGTPGQAAKMELWDLLARHPLGPGFLSVPHPYKRTSVFAAAVRLGVPVTVHPGIGYDIIYNHPLANGAALGRGGHIDYKIFCHSVGRLSGGVMLSVGSAIMAPQIFEKALSFANNLRLQSGEALSDYAILVDDLQASNWDWSRGEPPKGSPDYYLRFLKSFYRMGGTVRYAAVDNRVLLHHLLHRLGGAEIRNSALAGKPTAV